MNGSLSLHDAKNIRIKRKNSGRTTWTEIEIRGEHGEYFNVSVHDADPDAKATITGPGGDTELRAALADLLAECEAMHREYCPKCKAPCPTTAAMDNAKDILARE